MTKKQKNQIEIILTDAYNNYWKPLYVRALYKVSNPETCSDLVQDTFMKTWRYLVKGGKIQTMKSFLYHVLNHLIIDEYRKHKTTSLDTLLEKGFEPGMSETEHLSDILDGREALNLIDKIPKAYQSVMKMRYKEDMSIEEISLLTGQSKNNTAVQLHRGLSKLKVLYS